MHGPIMCQLGDAVRHTLEPLRLDGANAGKDRYSELVPLAYGGGGVLVRRAGRLSGSRGLRCLRHDGLVQHAQSCGSAGR